MMEIKNELFAEFLGWKRCNCGKGPAHYVFGSFNYDVIDVKDMKFHKSWDQLHIVIEKIDSLMPEIKIPRDIEAMKNGTHGSERYIDVISMPISTTIEEAYAEIVKFLEWYKEQPK